MEVSARNGSYEILIERGVLKNAGRELDLDRKTLVVTDDGVPQEYARSVLEQSSGGVLVTLPQGEQSKSLEKLELLLRTMLGHGFTRSDCVVAVGGGVVGDLAGFASSVYMRGIGFYNLPTTLLSQVDSSIGGKTAIDFCSVKNVVGAFRQPDKVLIDPDVLKTLDQRQFSAGMAEALKMAMTGDGELFELIAEQDVHASIDEIIARALKIKKTVVEEDEFEKGLRRVLNFGHTVGHAIESLYEGKLLHGECVALGMIPMCSQEVREKLLPVLEKLKLPTRCDFSVSEALRFALHDKKSDKDGVNVVKVEKIGRFSFEKMNEEQLKKAMLLIPGARE